MKTFSKWPLFLTDMETPCFYSWLSLSLADNKYLSAVCIHSTQAKSYPDFVKQWGFYSLAETKELHPRKDAPPFCSQILGPIPPQETKSSTL